LAGFSPLCPGEGPEERLIPQNAGKPKANEGGKWGFKGRCPLAGGCGGCPVHAD